MKINISGVGISLTEALKEKVNSKMSKLDKFFTDNTTAQVNLKTEGKKQAFEVTIPVKKNVIRISEVNDDLYAAIDLAIDKLERQIRKFRTKIRDKKIKEIVRNEDIGAFSDVDIEEDEKENIEIKIVKKKNFYLEPMTPEEACAELEMLNHNFFVFKNLETDSICVVYKRVDDAYGIIIPNEK